MTGFFSDLPALDRLDDIVDPEPYVDIPDSWYVVMTDVKGSTRAIEEGRYKDVNMVGVSTIIAVQNVLGAVQFPFVFGGDGASLAIPGEFLEPVERALSGTRAIARHDFKLNLRIAIFPASRIVGEGAELKVAKVRLSSTQTLAVLRGRGWSMAESWLKEREAEFALPESIPPEATIDGLECRWNPLPARKDEVLALIIQARAEGVAAFRIYQELLPRLYSQDRKPIGLGDLRFPWPPRYLWNEARMRVRGGLRRALYYVQRLMITLAVSILMTVRGRKRNLERPFEYLRELTENTDYLKFDECLRLIVDVSLAEKETILQLLEDQRKQGRIFYGHHADAAALLTCFVRGPHQHIHFVDANGGGYAMAAKELKAQRKEALALAGQAHTV